MRCFVTVGLVSLHSDLQYINMLYHVYTFVRARKCDLQISFLGRVSPVHGLNICSARFVFIKISFPLERFVLFKSPAFAAQEMVWCIAQEESTARAPLDIVALSELSDMFCLPFLAFCFRHTTVRLQAISGHICNSASKYIISAESVIFLISRLGTVPLHSTVFGTVDAPKLRLVADPG